MNEHKNINDRLRYIKDINYNAKYNFIEKKKENQYTNLKIIKNTFIDNLPFISKYNVQTFFNKKIKIIFVCTNDNFFN